ncbi:MAG: biopolymer transporter ExbD [Kiritimatiellae bacterium]|jgi:biopolymer transport protein ExbD|nr:biopolymer transporter ExbD [Kiritimatiellia bacterium]
MARKPQENPQLDMTPMIDVVFELIIFFVVTIKQEDLFTKLNANRPAPASSSSSSSESDTTVTIEIGRGRDANGVIVYNKREIRRKELDQNLKEVSRTSKKTPIIIRCAEDSPHKALVDVLDICYRNQLYSVSIFTL